MQNALITFRCYVLISHIAVAAVV